MCWGGRKKLQQLPELSLTSLLYSVHWNKLWLQPSCAQKSGWQAKPGQHLYKLLPHPCPEVIPPFPPLAKRPVPQCPGGHPQKRGVGWVIAKNGKELTDRRETFMGWLQIFCSGVHSGVQLTESLALALGWHYFCLVWTPWPACPHYLFVNIFVLEFPHHLSP